MVEFSALWSWNLMPVAASWEECKACEVPRGCLRRFLGAWRPLVVFVERPSSSKDYQLLEETKTPGKCSFTSQTASPQAPATSQNPSTGRSGNGDHPRETCVLCIPCGISTDWDLCSFPERAPKGTCGLPGLQFAWYARGFCWCLRAVARMSVRSAPR